jgi:hypothetical protein
MDLRGSVAIFTGLHTARRARASSAAHGFEIGLRIRSPLAPARTPGDQRNAAADTIVSPTLPTAAFLHLRQGGEISAASHSATQVPALLAVLTGTTPARVAGQRCGPSSTRARSSGGLF